MVGISRGRETAIRGLDPPAPEPEEDRPEPWVDPVKELDEPWENPFKDIQIGEPPLVPGPYTITTDNKTTPYKWLSREPLNGSIYQETEVAPRTGARTITTKTREGRVLFTVTEKNGMRSSSNDGLFPKWTMDSLKSY
jgi:hypothetical protein